MDFTKFRTLDMKLLDRVDKMLSDDIAKLMVIFSVFDKNCLYTYIFNIFNFFDKNLSYI